MATDANCGAAKILCVEHDAAVLESRCAVLKTSGYDSTSASPRMAAAVLSSHKFDLLVLSSLSDSEVNRLVNLADGASVLASRNSSCRQNCSLWSHSD